MIKYNFRSASEKDFPAIKRLIHDVGINPTGLNWRRFVIAETAAGNLAGCGQIKPHYDGTLELASIAVVVTERRRGLGSLMIRNLISETPRPLYLTCREQLGPFYSKFGFRIITGDELPKYFRRISQIAGFVKKIHLINDKLLVMVLD